MNYILAVFTSRTQTMLFYNKLKAKGVACSIINNPKATKVTCGICVKFYAYNLQVARSILNNNMTGFAGFYKYTDSFGLPKVSPLWKDYSFYKNYIKN